MERVHRVNSTSEYLYLITDVILFGGMLSNIERLGDVDIALQMEQATDEKPFELGPQLVGVQLKLREDHFAGDRLDLLPQMEMVLQLKPGLAV